MTESVALRQAMLEEGTPLRQSILGWINPQDPLDEHPETRHYAIEAGGEVIGISSVGPQPYGDQASAVRMFAVAVDEDYRGQKLWNELYTARLTYALTRGAPLLWSKVRDVAWTIYEAHGFTRLAEPVTDPNTGATVCAYGQWLIPEPAEVAPGH